MIAHKIFPLVIASFAMTGFAAHLVAQQPAGQKTIDIYSDAVGVGPQANSFSERLSQVDAAIRCRIERSNVRVTQDPDLPEGADPALGIQIVTEHAVTVLEILKGSSKLPLVGSLLNVTQPVGVATVNGVQARRVQGRFRPFAPGEEYVLLLKWNTHILAFTIEAADTFLLAEGVVDSPGKSPFGTPFVGSSEATFLWQIRLAAAAIR